MYTRHSLLFILLTFVMASVFSQETGKKTKQERDLEKQKQTEELVNSKIFLFTASTAFSQRGRAINLTSNPNTIVFSPDLISSDLPFFGRAYSGVTYGESSGYTFEGKPEEFTIEPAKKGYEIKAVVRTSKDSYTINLLVSSGGSSSLTISSNNLSTMSYSGEISKTEEKK